MAATRRLAVEDDVTNAASAGLPFARRSTIDNIDVSILSMAQPLYIIRENGLHCTKPRHPGLLPLDRVEIARGWRSLVLDFFKTVTLIPLMTELTVQRDTVKSGRFTRDTSVEAERGNQRHIPKLTQSVCLVISSMRSQTNWRCIN